MAGGDPGDDLRDQVCFCEAEDVGGGLRHAPPGTGGAKPTPLAAEGEQQVLVAGVTAQPEEPIGQDTTLQIVVEFAFYIGGEAAGVRIDIERGEQRLQMSGHDLLEQRLARIMGGIRGWGSVQR